MRSTIYIPEKINVGYQERNGTYTGKLAYVIYFDEKGVLRKERSWDSWRDKKIENNIYDNTPTEGFVLNKKAGGYSYGWNHRQTYTRVYDPRGFEFEITIENLLYILENTDSIKGKGLVGEFVYSWDGKDLLLLPVETIDYKAIKEYTEKVKNQVKLKGKDLKIGGTYLTKDNEELVYLGRFDYWETDYDKRMENKLGEGVWGFTQKGKRYFFHSDNYGSRITAISSLSKIISIVDENCHENLAEMFDKLDRSTDYSPIDHSKDEIVPYTFEEFQEKFQERAWGIDFFDSKHTRISLDKEYYRDLSDKFYENVRVPCTRTDWGGREYTSWTNEKQLVGSLQDVFNKYSPVYLRKFLKNGKLHSEGK